MKPEQVVQKILGFNLIKLWTPAYGAKLGTHVTVGVDHVATPDTKEVRIFRPVLTLYDRARAILGRPVPITAGYRSPGFQRDLIGRGYKAATFVSPHMISCALDLDAIPQEGKSEEKICREIVEAVEEAAEQLNLPDPRIGVKAYRWRFAHVDLLPMMFEPFTELPHPSTWDEDFEDLRGLPYMPYGTEAKTFIDRTWREGYRF